jgi:hypothetical protein
LLHSWSPLEFHWKSTVSTTLYSLDKRNLFTTPSHTLPMTFDIPIQSSASLL